jgi:hypothetical protein
MWRHYAILLLVVVTTSVHLTCLEFTGMGMDLPQNWRAIDVYVRNTSTSSGVNLYLPPWNYEGSGLDITLDPAPQPGVPVDSSDVVFGPHLFNWSLKTTIDNVVVATGEIYISWPVYVLIEENNGDWNCTWSIDGWVDLCKFWYHRLL